MFLIVLLFFLLEKNNEFVKKMKNENRQYKPLLAEEEFKNYTDIL